MFTALASRFSNTPLSKDVAMTGALTLRGRVLPIGGLKEKSIAALHAGVKTIIIPKLNEKDIPDLPDEVRQRLKIFAPLSNRHRFRFSRHPQQPDHLLLRWMAARPGESE